MAAELTKLGRIRKIVELRNQGDIRFKTADPDGYGRAENGWRPAHFDAFVFRNYFTKEQLVCSDLFFTIFGETKVAIDHMRQGFSVFMNGDFEAFLDYVLEVYHANFGEDYL